MFDAAKKIFDFLASLKLAVILLIVFAVLLSYATVLESNTSTEHVQRVIYKTLWFDLFLFMLGVNVVFSTLSRLPWKVRHTGFLVTHLGIIVVLIGSMITRKVGIEGQMMLQEGMVADSITVDEEVFSISIPPLGIHHEFKPSFAKNGIPQGKELRFHDDQSGVTLYAMNYLRNPSPVQRVTGDGANPNPAVQVSLQRTGSTQSELSDWLFADAPMMNTLDMSLAKIKFQRIESETALQEQLKQPEQPTVVPSDGPKGRIKLVDAQGATVHEFDVEAILSAPYTFEWNGQPYAVQYKEFIPRAVVKENVLINNEAGALNPVIKFTLSGPKGSEEHLSFAKFPEFGSVHGKQESGNGLQAHFDYPLLESASSANANEMIVYLDPAGKLHYRVTTTAGGWNTGPMEPGQSVKTGWNDLEVIVGAFYPNARRTEQLVDMGMSAQDGMHGNPAVQYRVEYQEQQAQGFALYNEQSGATLGDNQAIVYYGQRKVPVGFTIRLIDFMAPRYPGTNRPAEFKSQVKLLDPPKNVEREQLIYMNHPLAYNDFLVYQASYIEGTNGGPDISIFSVAKAPGTSIIYLGTIISVIGMLLMFCTKKFSSLAYYKIKRLEEKGETS